MADINIKADVKQTSTLGKVKVLVEQVVGQPSQAQISQAVADYIDNHPGALSPLSQATKSALLTIAEKVAYIDANGQSYYNALEAAFDERTVLSIDAVFTQGSATIYDSDDLDDLKQYLVVTAYYDDGSTANVTSACELSGTLEEGTSTITATYGGKSDTFDVTVTSIANKPLPSGYTQYDYVTSAKKNLEYAGKIVLNAYDNLDVLSLRVKLLLQSSIEKDVAIFGSRTQSSYIYSYAVYMAPSDANHIRMVARQTSMVYSTAITKGTPFELKFDNPSVSPATLQIDDGEVESFAWTEQQTITPPIALFCNALEGNSSYNVPYIQIGDIILSDADGNIVGYYVPCTNDSNRIGMYDLVTDTFCTSSTASYTTVGNSSCPYSVGNWS